MKTFQRLMLVVTLVGVGIAFLSSLPLGSHTILLTGAAAAVIGQSLVPDAWRWWIRASVIAVGGLLAAVGLTLFPQYRSSYVTVIQLIGFGSASLPSWNHVLWVAGGVSVAGALADSGLLLGNSVRLSQLPIIPLGCLAAAALIHGFNRNQRRIEELSGRWSDKARELQRTLDVSPDIIAEIQSDGTLRSVNQALLPTMGYAPEELIGRSMVEWVHPDDIATAGDVLQAALAAGGAVFQGSIRAIRKDGSVIFLAWKVTYVVEDQLLYCVARDVTQTEAAQQRLAFLGGASALMSSGDYHTALAGVADVAVTTIADFCAIDLLEPDGQTRRLAASSAPNHIAMADGRLVRQVMETGESRLTGQMLVVPILVHDAVHATISLAVSGSGRRFGPDEKAAVEGFAGRAALTIEHTLLHRFTSAITQCLGEGVCTVSAEGLVTFANPAAERMLGCGPGELVGERWCTLFRILPLPCAECSGGCRLIPPLVAGEIGREEEGRFLRKDGTEFPAAFTAAPIVAEGVPLGAVVAFRDVTERKRFEEQLTYQAFHDSLTGLPNRALLMDRLAQTLARCRRRGELLALLFADLDHFKAINDSFGHAMGDQLLKVVGQRLLEGVRAEDTIARLGGDEFAVLVENVRDESEAAGVAQRLLDRLNVPLTLNGRELVVAASIGLVMLRPDHCTPDDLLHDADVAMYQAKQSGRGRLAVFRPQLSGRSRDRLELEQDLRGAAGRGELFLLYQPIVALEDGRITSMEALVRWRHPQRGLLSPGEFIPLAEETGLIVSLGRWVTEEACRQLAAWLAEYSAGLVPRLGVNVSAREFADPGLVEHMAGLMHRYGIPPGYLELEITESALMLDSHVARNVLPGLKDLGITLAIDDFGSGYSSLGYLHRFPFDTIKVDKLFVDGLPSSPRDATIITAVVAVGQSLGLSVTAEGIETAEQLHALQAIGCPLGQGYLFSRPVAAAEAGRLIQGNRPSLPRP